VIQLIYGLIHLGILVSQLRIQSFNEEVLYISCPAKSALAKLLQKPEGKLVPAVNAYISLEKTNFLAPTIRLTTPGATVLNTSFRMMWIVRSTNVELWILR
jgi:hypothetical protein